MLDCVRRSRVSGIGLPPAKRVAMKLLGKKPDDEVRPMDQQHDSIDDQHDSIDDQHGGGD